MKKDEYPLGPPPTTGIKGLEELVLDKRKKKGVWQKIPQTKKDKKLRKKWEKEMKKADSKRKWRFKWPIA